MASQQADSKVGLSMHKLPALLLTTLTQNVLQQTCLTKGICRHCICLPYLLVVQPLWW